MTRPIVPATPAEFLDFAFPAAPRTHRTAIALAAAAHDLGDRERCEAALAAAIAGARYAHQLRSVACFAAWHGYPAEAEAAFLAEVARCADGERALAIAIAAEALGYRAAARRANQRAERRALLGRTKALARHNLNRLERTVAPDRPAAIDWRGLAKLVREAV